MKTKRCNDMENKFKFIAELRSSLHGTLVTISFVATDWNNALSTIERWYEEHYFDDYFYPSLQLIKLYIINPSD